jgi:hypothetical protein
MRRSRLCVVLLIAIALVAVSPPLSATNVLQMNLQEMVERSDRIFRGTVLDAKEGTLAAGGGELPIVTYRIRVEEALKGTFEEVKGVQIAEVKMLGKLKRTGSTSAVQAVSAIPDLPRLVVGQEYLLLTTPRSAIGLSTTVGLGQGLFVISGKEGQEVAVNGNHNYGLFLDMPGSPDTGGPGEPGRALPYEGLATIIRDLAGE